MLQQSTTLPAAKKKGGINKLIMGFAAVAATAVIGATGFVAAQHDDKPTKAQCAAAGYTNYGQCVKDWAHTKPGGGYGGGGYGGNQTAGSVSVNLDVRNSNNNIIEVIINFFS